ncbi:MAG: protein kinase [Planctomycetes bacterium]|nr:protein kinase [Planctomycetota bacterium]
MRPMTEPRYTLGKEIGHGGLGRVVAARDGVLRRDVAIKLVLDGLPPELRDRFVREAALTAQLEHPNIVPVHDLAELPGPDGHSRLALTMKRVLGRDLGKLLVELAKGDPATVETYSRGRLLSIVQDICLGVAFAHSKGIIHRDLKPANVMIGDYGETLIVDWGLAKEKSEAGHLEADGAALPIAANDPAATMLLLRTSGSSLQTLEGSVVGTPGYMSPEQAAGHQSEVDERSDIWALGAILFEVLTLHPPFEADSIAELLDKARFGIVPAPSSVAPAIPHDLDAICRRAMAPRKDQRFPSALALHREIQQFLEGVKEREREEKEARERVEKGQGHLRRYRELAGEIERQAKTVKEWSGRIKPHQPAEEKRPLWDAEAQHRRLEEERIRAFASASAEFGQALTVKGDCVEARDGLCDLSLDRFLEAERRRDRKEMLIHRSTLEIHDRAQRYREMLEAPGELSLRTFAYGCKCLEPICHPGWRVEIGESSTIPWRDGRARPDSPLTDRDVPVPIVKTQPEGVRWGHTAGCPRQEVRGAEVWIARYEERDKRLQLGELKLLGRTPLAGTKLPQGSYRCTLKAAGFAETLLPVRIDRGAMWAQDVNLYRASEIPPGACYVPGGPYIFGGQHAGGGPEATKVTEDFFVAKWPLTAGEYLEFLNDLCAAGLKEEARKHQPREGDTRYFGETPSGFALLPADDAKTLIKAPDYAVFGISWFDAVAYVSWRTKCDGLPATLMHEEEWEKAARGVDARAYPYGDEFDGSYAHTNNSVPGGLRPLPMGTFAADESPYGIRDLGGGVQTWLLNAPEVPYRDWFCMRGGTWSQGAQISSAAYRQATHPRHVHWSSGVRLAWRPWA